MLNKLKTVALLASVGTFAYIVYFGSLEVTSPDVSTTIGTQQIEQNKEDYNACTNRCLGMRNAMPNPNTFYYGCIKACQKYQFRDHRVELPCCWDVPVGTTCRRCRIGSYSDPNVIDAINPDVRTVCRTKWRPLPYKANAYCVRYGGSLWLCPVEVCEWKQI